MKKLKITIPEPCHENWNNMIPVDRGKFCASCQKCVVDFSTYSDEALMNYFKTPRANTCGHFNSTQVGRYILPTINPKPSFYSKAALAMVVFLSLFHEAKSEKVPHQTIQTQNLKNKNFPNDEAGPFGRTNKLSDSSKYISGKLVDSMAKDPIRGVVKIVGTEISAESDSEGNFKLSIPDSMTDSSITLNVRVTGYYVEDIQLGKSNFPCHKDIEISQVNFTMSGGLLAVYEKPSLWQRFKRHFHSRKKEKDME